MVECLEVVRRLWTEDTVDHQGRHFTLDGARMPLNRCKTPIPHLDCGQQRCGGGAGGSAGLHLVRESHATYETIKDQIELYRRAGVEAGTDAAHSPLPWRGNCSSTQTGRPHTRRRARY